MANGLELAKRIRAAADGLNRRMGVIRSRSLFDTSPATQELEELYVVANEVETNKLEAVELLRIFAPIIERAIFQGVDFDDDGFERWLEAERTFPFTDCHNCGGNIGTPRKWLSHTCTEAS